MIFRKWGGGQRPFGTFPKIHQFWRCHPSLTSLLPFSTIQTLNWAVSQFLQCLTLGSWRNRTISQPLQIIDCALLLAFADTTTLPIKVLTVELSSSWAVWWNSLWGQFQQTGAAMSCPLTAVNDSRLERSENRWGWTNSHKFSQKWNFQYFSAVPHPHVGKNFQNILSNKRAFSDKSYILWYNPKLLLSRSGKKW